MLIALGLATVGLMALFLVRQLVYPMPYREVIVECAARHDVDPDLVAAVIREESRFRPRAVSPRGARGLMQLMPPTAEWVAHEHGYPDEKDLDLFDPEVNVDLGTGYLAHLLKHFDGSIPLAVAAYNRGMTRVTSWVEDGVWCGSSHKVHRIPTEETRVYVRRVLRSYAVYGILNWITPSPERSGILD